MTKKTPVLGSPWTNESKHETFEVADDRRNSLLKEEGSDLQVKVKRLFVSSGRALFVVKTRKPQEQKQGKKGKKGKKAKQGKKKKAVSAKEA